MTTNASEFLTISQAAAACPTRPHVSAIWRWCRKGLLARDGERLYLTHIRLGGRLLIRRRDLEKFAEALAAADVQYFRTEGQVTADLTDSQVEAKLIAAGL